MSDFCIKAQLNKDEIVKIVNDIALNIKTTYASPTILIDYLSYWTDAYKPIKKKAMKPFKIPNRTKSLYDYRTGYESFPTDTSNIQNGVRAQMDQFSEETSESLMQYGDTMSSTRSYAKVLYEEENKYIMPAKESVATFLKEVAADDNKIKNILSDLNHLDHFRKTVLDREDVNSLSVEELKELFSKYLQFLDIELEKSGFYYFAGKQI